jgi:hypothetical protein
MPDGSAAVQHIELHACLASSFCLVSGDSSTFYDLLARSSTESGTCFRAVLIGFPWHLGTRQRTWSCRPAAHAESGSPVDLTGYWVSIVTEDWRWRMVTPPKGDYASVPLNAEGRKVADAWDPAKDETAGEQCKAYGAPGLIRLPGRLRIQWENDTALRLDADAGTQTRALSFGVPTTAAVNPSAHGTSLAKWDTMPAGRGVLGGPDASVPSGALKVVTTHMRPGYLRKNGVPYSENTTLTEYYNVTKEQNGDQWLVITAIVEDPKYLNQSFITSTHFKKEPDGSKWSPTPCTSR